MPSSGPTFTAGCRGGLHRLQQRVPEDEGAAGLVLSGPPVAPAEWVAFKTWLGFQSPDLISQVSALSQRDAVRLAGDFQEWAFEVLFLVDRAVERA